MKNPQFRKACFSLLWTCVLCAFALAASQSARAGEGFVSLEDAVRLCLLNNFDIRIARNSAEAARNDIGRGTAGFLPTLDSQGNLLYDNTHSRGGDTIAGGNRDFRTYGSLLNLNWTLFDGFRMFADNRRFRELARAGEEQARDAIESTVVSAMSAYLNLVQQQQLLGVARTNRDISRARLEREEVRRSLGGASSTDLLNARVNFNTDQTLLLEQELRVSIARKELNLLLARDPETAVEVEKEIHVPELALSLPELQERSLEESAALQTARFRMQAAAEQVRVTDSAFWPQLVLGGQYGYTNRRALESSGGIAIDNTRTLDASASLLLNFNIFNGNIDRINAQNARLEAKSASLLHEDIRNRVSGLMYELHKTFLKQVEVVDLETQNTVTAEQNLQLQKERYQTGAADSLDFRDAQVNLLRAESSLITARYQARIALLNIQRLIGEIAIN